MNGLWDQHAFYYIFLLFDWMVVCQNNIHVHLILSKHFGGMCDNVHLLEAKWMHSFMLLSSKQSFVMWFVHVSMFESLILLSLMNNYIKDSSKATEGSLTIAKITSNTGLERIEQTFVRDSVYERKQILFAFVNERKWKTSSALERLF